MGDIRTILDNLKTDMNEKRTAREAAAAEASGKVRERKETISKLQEKASKAEAERNTALYAEISKQIETEKHFAFLDEKREQEIENRACYTVAEFKEHVSAINNAVADLEAPALKEARGHIEALQRIRGELEAANAESNAVISELQDLTGLKRDGMRSTINEIGFNTRPAQSNTACVIEEIETICKRAGIITA